MRLRRAALAASAESRSLPALDLLPGAERSRESRAERPVPMASAGDMKTKVAGVQLQQRARPRQAATAAAAKHSLQPAQHLSTCLHCRVLPLEARQLRLPVQPQGQDECG